MCPLGSLKHHRNSEKTARGLKRNFKKANSACLMWLRRLPCVFRWCILLSGVIVFLLGLGYDFMSKSSLIQSVVATLNCLATLCLSRCLYDPLAHLAHNFFCSNQSGPWLWSSIYGLEVCYNSGIENDAPFPLLIWAGWRPRHNLPRNLTKFTY